MWTWIILLLYYHRQAPILLYKRMELIPGNLWFWWPFPTKIVIKRPFPSAFLHVHMAFSTIIVAECLLCVGFAFYRILSVSTSCYSNTWDTDTCPGIFSQSSSLSTPESAKSSYWSNILQGYEQRATCAMVDSSSKSDWYRFQWGYWQTQRYKLFLLHYT